MQFLSKSLGTCRLGLVLASVAVAAFAPQQAGAADSKPNILVIFGDDIGTSNLSA